MSALCSIRPVLLAGVAFVFAAPAGAAGAPRTSAPVSTALRACPFLVPDSVNAPASVMREEVAPPDDPDEDDDDDDADDDEGDEDDAPAAATPVAGPGWTLGDGCLFVGGEVNASMQAVRLGGSLGRLVGRRANVTTFVPKSTVTVRHMQPTAWGDVIGRVALDTVDGAMSINQASLTIGGWVVGMETSFFDAWSADEFSFRALASSQSPMLLGTTLRFGDSVVLSAALEDQTFRRVTVTGYAGQSLPDVVGRLRGVFGPADLTLTGAFHQTRLTLGSDRTLQGVAAQASLKLDLPLATDGSYLVLQGAWTRDAPGYLGISTRNSVFALPVGDIFSAGIAERSNGWSAALAGNWQITPTWSSAAFVTVLGLDMPLAAASRPGLSVRSLRSAVNLTWQPVEDFSVTVEAGYARLESRLTVLPASRSTSVILSMTRSF